MKMANTPQMVIVQTGKLFKVLQVTGGEGMSMPEHFSTKEAVLIIQNGSAVLTMAGKEYPLKQYESVLIPEAQKHTLRINENFQAHVIMAIDSEIAF